VEVANTQGVSAALYYLFTYVFMVIGSFAVITVMSRDGDLGNQISDYRGLAKRQPVLALAFAALLLGQAGIPFTTGFLAKFGVVGASVDSHAYTLATVAMVSAAIAAFFYLRVAVTMYSPVGRIGDTGGDDQEEDTAWEDLDGSPAASTTPADPLAGVTAAGAATAAASEVDPPDSVFDRVASLQTLTDAPPADPVVDRGVVPVPWLTSLVIGISVAFTVVFGIIPGPILDFAHQATLLFP
jgi:NADH-quinone oxidoreductase subunit N